MKEEKRTKVENKFARRKTLTWILAVAVFGIVQATLIQFDISLGALWMVVLVGAIFGIATAISKKINKNKKISLAEFDAPLQLQQSTRDTVPNISSITDLNRKKEYGQFYGEDMMLQKSDPDSLNNEEYFEHLERAMPKEGYSTSNTLANTNSRKLTLSTCILLILVIVLAFLLFYTCVFSNNSSELKELEEKYSSLKQDYSELKDIKSELVAEKQLLESKIYKLEDELSYYDCVVFVLDDGTRKYHKYDCDIFQKYAGDLWVYIDNGAENNGYYACPECH